jgi:hypothetical protein
VRRETLAPPKRLIPGDLKAIVLLRLRTALFLLRAGKATATDRGSV